MLIDCARCPVQGPGCPDCVVTVLLDRAPVPVELDPAERRALRQLARAGLVRPLGGEPESSGFASASAG